VRERDLIFFEKTPFPYTFVCIYISPFALSLGTERSYFDDDWTFASVALLGTVLHVDL
jgi:hypothetical protein